MFEKFTSRAQQILKIFAQEEAKRLGHDVILPEHIFLGLLREGEGVAVRVLLNLGLDIDILKDEIELSLHEGNNTIVFGELPLTKSTKDIIKEAQEISKEFGDNYTGTEHLLLAIIKHKNNTVSEILNTEGIYYDDIVEEILKLLGKTNTFIPLKKKSKKSTPTLDKFSQDLTKLSKEGKIDPVIGRENEIERLIHILCRRTKNNPVLVGEPGVGKTAIVEGLARRIAEGDVPENLQNKRLVILDIAGIVAGTKYRGEFEERIKKILNEIEKSDDIILFIDEIHTLIGAGGAEGALDAANILKPKLAKGLLRCIGATTLDEYRKYIERDSALERRFQMILVEEPSIEETIEIIKGIKNKYEQYHNVIYDDKAIEIAVKLSDRYITDRYLPDKAIDLIDEAGAKVKIKKVTKPKELNKLEKKISALNLEKSELVKKQLYELASKKRDEIKLLTEKYERIHSNWVKRIQKQNIRVTEDTIYEIVSNWTKIPVHRLAETEVDRLLKMEKILKKRVVGQDDAIDKIARAVRRARTNIKDPKRPSGSFIFLGPSGVGKTQLARSLAEFLFGDESSLIRIDMSDFMEKHSISRLTGAPPGYVGYEEGGILTEKVRRNPYSVILFDEIEKAHPDVFNILLQVLEEGELSDNLGHTVDFRNCIIIMTSNIGANYIDETNTIGFEKELEKNINKDKSIESNIKKKMKKIFRPEFLNRIDEIVVFKPLTEKSLFKIVNILIKEVEERLEEYNIKLSLTKSAKKYLIKKGYSKIYGARPLKRTIQKEIEDKLAVSLLKKELLPNSTVKISTINKTLKFDVTKNTD